MIKDHHVPLNEQQQNIESADEHEPSLATQNERPLTPNNSNRFDTNVWVNLVKKKIVDFEFSLFILANTTIR